MGDGLEIVAVNRAEFIKRMERASFAERERARQTVTKQTHTIDQEWQALEMLGLTP